jgi:hypothetical protein
MKIFLTDVEVLELSMDALDLANPNPDKVHDIAKKLDMVYNEELDMYEDVELVSQRILRHKLSGFDKSIYQNKMLVRPEGREADLIP